MKDITKLMIDIYNLNKLNLDFLGYIKNEESIYTFHHLIIPKCENGEKSLINGAILFRTDHDYLHIIENYDLDIFYALTSEMIDLNIKKFIDVKNLININYILDDFEKRYVGKYNNRGNLIIKDEYTRRLVKSKL